jgi:hypothetical protein
MLAIAVDPQSRQLRRRSRTRLCSSGDHGKVPAPSSGEFLFGPTTANKPRERRRERARPMTVTTVTFQQNFPAGCPSVAQPYAEAGLTFTNNVGNLWASPFVNRFVGTYGSPSKLIVTASGGGMFGFISLQVCNANTAIPAQTITFTGIHADGSTVSQQFTTPANSTEPQTFAPQNFGHLTSLVVDLGFVAFDTMLVYLPPLQTVSFNQGFPPGCPSNIAVYSENGLSFTNSVGNLWASPFINNFVGTYGSPSVLTVKPQNAPIFHFRSLQICSPNTAIDSQTVTFIGTRADGSSVEASFVTPAYSSAPQTFQTAGFDGLVQLDVQLGFVAFDNLVFLIPG